MEYEFVLNVLYTCRWYQRHVEVSNFNQNVNIWVKYACIDFFLYSYRNVQMCERTFPIKRRN